jgi:hypothetical protein
LVRSHYTCKGISSVTSSETEDVCLDL